MAKTQYYTATSIDGYIADPDNSLGWLFEVGGGEDSGADRFHTFFAQVGAFAMGATTYEWILDHEKLLDQPRKWTDEYGDVPAWVFTHGGVEAWATSGWPNEPHSAILKSWRAHSARRHHPCRRLEILESWRAHSA